eukprot:5231433-Pyramimonas_sp.AAC.1
MACTHKVVASHLSLRRVRLSMKQDSCCSVCRRTVGAQRQVVATGLIRPASHEIQSGLGPHAIERN